MMMGNVLYIVTLERKFEIKLSRLLNLNNKLLLQRVFSRHKLGFCG